MILANGCPKSGTHALMAWFESMGLKRAPGNPDPVEAMDLFFGKPFIPRYQSFLAWRGHCTIIRFEDLVAPPRGETYSGKLSDWRRCWRRDIDRAWKNRGGPELVKESGYE